MIVINTALKQEEIKKVLEGITEPKFTFVKKTGLKLYFQCDSADSAAAAAVAKKALKAAPDLAMVYFNITVE